VASHRQSWSSIIRNVSAVTQPFVSIVTPLYNCAEFLEQCIESVLAQTYGNWEYIIINNRSTDGSAEIARRYAARYPKIRVIDAPTFLPALANHNLSLRQISPESRYCKVVFADDWIFPQCLSAMVELAEANPTIGIVGAYGLQGTDVKWAGLPYSTQLVSGREVCRRYLLNDTNPFGTAHSVLFRSDLVRARDPFYDESNWHSDRETCVALLRRCDFGFVHQVLTYTRDRPGSANTVAANMNTYVAGLLNDLLLHGEYFLTPDEYRARIRHVEHEYYNFLAVSLVRGRRDKAFWAYHRTKLESSSLGFSRLRLARATVARVFRAVFNPTETLDKLLRH
jgi:glycosyltransferase involved in cell wall biosynthesis